MLLTGASSRRLQKKGALASLAEAMGDMRHSQHLTFSPDFFACSIAVCGPSNLNTILQKISPFWEIPSFYKNGASALYTKQAFILSMGGDPTKEEDIPHLESRSPLNFVDQIKKPLLLVHGENDPIVASSESDQIFAAMKKQPAIYIRFPDEGHAINKPANSFCYLTYTEWFLAQFLGGRFEPMHEEDLKSSSAKIQTHNTTILN